MHYFVLFSSIFAIIGNKGRSELVAGNTFEDALARYRVSRSERAESINLGLFLPAGIPSRDKS
ncbi:hypothetical protein F4777DRAFT_548876 [Nemania sp. FL0916]|nr:hypothetical protein F4777DRAFT_548876 [Nemania sp. FL0916]